MHKTEPTLIDVLIWQPVLVQIADAIHAYDDHANSPRADWVSRSDGDRPLTH